MGEEEVQEPTEQPTEEPPALDDDNVVVRAEKAAERLEAASAKLAEQLKRQEALRVKEMLGGKSDANAQKQEETPKEYVERLRKENAL